jgi:hypothetical protein
LCAPATLPACAATPAAYRVRFADVAHGAAVGYDDQRALVIELQPGERIPVNLQFDGEDFDLVPAHPSLEFVAKHHCFVRIWRDGIRASLDGVACCAGQRVRPKRKAGGARANGPRARVRQGRTAQSRQAGAQTASMR